MMRKKRRYSVDTGDQPASTNKTKKNRSTGRQSKQDVPETNESVFGRFLREAGVTVKNGGSSNEIAVDQLVFQKRIQKQLQKSPSYPGVIQEFISGLESYVENPDRFRNCLLPCVPQLPDGDCSSVSSFQESLLRMLLGIEMLQTLITNILLEKLPEFMLDGPVNGGLSIPRMIINQLKWLDRVVDTKELAAKLMELVSVAPVEVQCDIITSLPEILEDSQHNDIARELNSLLQENTQLTVPILDALSSFNLSSSLLAEVRSAVMATLAAVQLEDLPVVVKFILHSVSASDANEVVCNLRKKLELEQCVLPPVLQASQSRMKSKGGSTPAAGSSQDSIVLILDCIKSAVRFQKSISEAWLKAVESVDEVEDHKIIDLLVLFILHSTNSNQSRRGAERVLKAKVRNGLIQEPLLQKTFRDNAQVLRGYFPSILALGQSLVRSPDPSAVSFGGHMYRHAFAAFDTYCHQEVVGSLVTHVCSGVGGEVDTALELLCGLVTENPSEMALYAVFVKGILDYMDNLSPQQIRRLFHLLSKLAFGQQQQGSHIQDDMHIVIRKQLSSTVPKYKRIGIIGAVMIVGSMGALRPKVEESQNGSLSQETSRQVTALLDLVKSSSESSPEAAALYYDELANLISDSTLDPQVQEMIGKRVLDDFQEDFIVDVGPEIKSSFTFPVCVMYDLDEEGSQGRIAINLLPLLDIHFQHKGEQHNLNQKAPKRGSPLCLSPFFRLLRLCEEKLHQGDLEEIDGLLGCPLILTDMEVVEKIESLSKTEREFLCTLLFHTINWFREVINAFCRLKETEMKMKVMTRLQNITYLQSLLERALAGTPGYVPPVCNFDGESAEGIVLSASAPVNKAKKGSGKKRKAAGKNSSENSFQSEEATEADETQQEQPEKEKEKETRPGVSLVSYKQFFRELDLEVLSVLQCGLLSRSVLDSELQIKVQEEVLLGPAELVFLLEDLLRKVEFSLTAAPAKRAPFLKGRADKSLGFSHLQQKSPKDIASCCVQLMPALCSHLENCHNHFQALLSENNGVVDGPVTDVQEHQLMSASYQLLLHILITIFRWSGFSQPGQRSLLKKALGVLAGRLKECSAELSLEQLVKHSFEYLLNFRSTMPSLGTALCFTQLLSNVSEKGGSSAAYREKITSLAQRFLSQEWVTASGERERGNKFNEALHTLLSIYLENVDDVLKAVEELAGNGIAELITASKDASSSSWPTLSRQTFLVFYKVLMAELEKAVRKIPAVKISDSTEAQSEKLLTWNLAVRDFHILVNLVKVFDSRPVLNVCLKYGRLFLESFLKLGMPLLDYSFKGHKEDVQSLLKTFQLSTRQLHHMCGHSKLHQDTSLTNHVPALKKSLEQFLYRVKAMLTLNNCQEAFWMGNLKNRNLKGEEILSQREEGDEDGDDDADEEVQQSPAQEHSDDEAQESDSEESRTIHKRDDEDEITDDSE
ncbi:Fanconi anemia group D2 protein isoform X2 [Parambassis ranga]|uniref:Fanconi anemia group D2 protein isoform X2 n=1 Tax=Parambassis ranga TaxID=210632 RepID=A0A6P7I7J2_9TELE|nr:Fanconi anemia group D2 protein isoform X2 [Parambassis ranga]